MHVEVDSNWWNCITYQIAYACGLGMNEAINFIVKNTVKEPRPSMGRGKNLLEIK